MPATSPTPKIINRLEGRALSRPAVGTAARWSRMTQRSSLQVGFGMDFREAGAALGVEVALDFHEAMKSG
jgi:hypothetical protein